MRKERRTAAGWKLRVYMDAIRDAEGMTDAAWVESQASYPASGQYLTRSTWIAYLKDCALVESKRYLELTENEAA